MDNGTRRGADIRARLATLEAEGRVPRAILLGVDAHASFMAWAAEHCKVVADGDGASFCGLPVYCVSYLAPMEWAVEIR